MKLDLIFIQLKEIRVFDKKNRKFKTHQSLQFIKKWVTRAIKVLVHRLSLKPSIYPGVVDSTYKEVPSRQELRFSKGRTRDANLRVYFVYDYWQDWPFCPQLGYWLLSSGGRTLSILQNTAFPEHGKPAGAYTVSYDPNSPSKFSFRKRLGWNGHILCLMEEKLRYGLCLEVISCQYKTALILTSASNKKNVNNISHYNLNRK